MLALLSTALSPTPLIVPTWPLFSIVCLSSVVWSGSIQAAGHCCVNGRPCWAPRTLNHSAWQQPLLELKLHSVTIFLSHSPFEIYYTFITVIPDVCMISSHCLFTPTFPVCLDYALLFIIVCSCLSSWLVPQSGHSLFQECFQLAVQQPYLFGSCAL